MCMCVCIQLTMGLSVSVYMKHVMSLSKKMKTRRIIPHTVVPKIVQRFIHDWRVQKWKASKTCYLISINGAQLYSHTFFFKVLPSLKGLFLLILEKMEIPFLATDVQSVSSLLLLPVNNFSSLRRRSVCVWARAIPALTAANADTPHYLAESWFPRLITTFIIDKVTRNHFIVSIIQLSDCIPVPLSFSRYKFNGAGAQAVI